MCEWGRIRSTEISFGTLTTTEFISLLYDIFEWNKNACNFQQLNIEKWHGWNVRNFFPMRKSFERRKIPFGPRFYSLQTLTIVIWIDSNLFIAFCATFILQRYNSTLEQPVDKNWFPERMLILLLPVPVYVLMKWVWCHLCQFPCIQTWAILFTFRCC